MYGKKENEEGEEDEENDNDDDDETKNKNRYCVYLVKFYIFPLSVINRW